MGLPAVKYRQIWKTTKCELLQVRIGGYPCRITQLSATNLTCQAGPGSPTGLSAVEVSVDGHGAALGNATLARVFQLNSVAPTSGSQAGQLRRQPDALLDLATLG